MDSAGTLDAADVRISGGRIAEVGKGLTACFGRNDLGAGRGALLMPGLFGVVTALDVEEVSLEPSIVDNAYTRVSVRVRCRRAEFDVRPAFNPSSTVIGVNRVDGISFALVAPGAAAGGSIFAGIGAVARPDGLAALRAARTTPCGRVRRSLCASSRAHAQSGAGRIIACLETAPSTITCRHLRAAGISQVWAVVAALSPRTRALPT